MSELGGPEYPPLGEGRGEREFEVTHRQLAAGERLILVTDGITGRRVEDDGTIVVMAIE